MDYYVKKIFGNAVISMTCFEKDLCEKFKFNFSQLVEIEKKHVGKDYILFKTKKNEFLGIERKLYEEVISYINMVEDIFDIKVYSDDKTKVYFKIESYICIIEVCSNLDKIRGIEYEYLSQIFKTYNDFVLPEILCDICFDNLDDKLFEDLCFDILDLEGYFDIHPLGKTRASDGGRDLFATKNIVSIDGERKIEKWIIQCKYSKQKNKNSFPRAMFSEVPDMLEENYSDKFLLITTSELTPQTVARINSINCRKQNIIEYFAMKELKLVLSRYPNLLYKYKLIKSI